MSVKCALAGQVKDTGGGDLVILQTIAVTTPPTKTSYLSGEAFNTSGMVVTGYYGLQPSAIISSVALVGYTITPSVLTDEVTFVTITYTESGQSYTTTQSVSITPIPVNMTITTAPTATQTYLDTIDKTGTVATITYSNNSTATKSADDLTLTSPSGSTWSAVGNQTMTFSYTENTITVTGSTAVTVNKAAQSISFNPTALTFNESEYSKTTTMTYKGNGIVSVQSGTKTGLSVSIGTPGASATNTASTVVITANGDGSTAFSASTVTISVAESTYFLAGTGTFTVTATYWTFNGGETADASWWSTLKTKVQAGQAQSSWVGKEVNVTLSSAVQGTTTHLVRCIGINQDGNNTITFQTTNGLATASAFSSSRTARWMSSIARTICQSYYNAFPGKNYIKTVSKGTAAELTNSSATYNNETVWLPSVRELGTSSSTYEPTAASQEFTSGCSTPYSYYTSDSSRIKKASDSSSASTRNYWTRTLSKYSSQYGYTIYIKTDGTPGGGNRPDTSSYSIAPAFVIG